MQGRAIDTPTSLQGRYGGESLIKDGGIGRIGTELRAQDLAQRPPRDRDQQEAADVRLSLRCCQSNEPALAVAEQPDAGASSQLPNLRNPGPYIRGIVDNGDGVRVRCGGGTGMHAPLVDPEGGNALSRKSLGDEAVG